MNVRTQASHASHEFQCETRTALILRYSYDRYAIGIIIVVENKTETKQS